MKQFALALLGSVAALTSLAQNLVPNPSFEEYLECPQSTGELHQQTMDWYSWQETPDFFHSCNNEGLGTAGVPENAWGSQLPMTGSGYTGLFTYVDYAENGREYIAAPLNQPLNVGSTYYMMLHASQFDGGEKGFRWCANNNIGMRFFRDPDYHAFPPNANPLYPDNFAHLNYISVLDDFTNWTLIEGWFTADDSYNWVAIGNFFTDDQTETLILNTEKQCVGIYYIENVCVAPTPEECEYLLSSKDDLRRLEIEIFPNPASVFVRLNLPVEGMFTGEIMDLQGRSLAAFPNLRSGTEINVSNFLKGVYVLRIFNDQFFSSTKLLIQ